MYGINRFLALGLTLGSLCLPLASFAQAGFSPQFSPGAIMAGQQRNFWLQQTQPYTFRPFYGKDTSIPENPVTIQPGVIPDDGTGTTQGILTTPDGGVFIGPRN